MTHFFRICIFFFGFLGVTGGLVAQPSLPSASDSTALEAAGNANQDSTRLVTFKSPDPDTTTLLTINNVSVEGNYRTRTTIILREMALTPGDTLTEKKLIDLMEVDRRKIVNTNLFITVDMTYFPDPQNPLLVNVRVVVKERWYFVILPVFQLADRNFNEWWYERKRDFRRTTYGLYMSYKNLTGRADRLALEANFGFVPRYQISYSVPYIDKAQKTGITTGMSYTTNKTLPYRTWRDKLDFFDSENLNRERFYTFVSLTRRNKFYGFHGLDLRWNYLQLSDTLARLNPNYLLGARSEQYYFQMTYTYAYDRRDNVQYALRGFRYGIQASKLGLLPNDNVNQAYLYGWYNRYIALGKKDRWFYNTGLTSRVSVPVKQPYAQIAGLGYRLNLVRGYELYVIDGQHYFLWDNELKYKLFDVRKHISWLPIRQFNTIPLTAYLNSYADMGYVKNYYPELSNTNLGNKLLAGAGVGFDVVTFYNMVFRFNYTINALGQDRFFFQIGRVL